MHVKITLERFVTENVRDVNLMLSFSGGKWNKQKTGDDNKRDNFNGNDPAKGQITFRSFWHIGSWMRQRAVLPTTAPAAMTAQGDTVSAFPGM
ncbi:MAG: hypothetical protein HQ580_00015 [Planctomycetes bacterium]|nr:hypothetical protein [Planctomycetota bacterium]